MNKEIAPEVIRQLLRYDPDTGKLFWLERPEKFFATPVAAKRWNARYAGSQALTAVSPGGYLVGCILGRPWRAHRVIWAMQTGSWPKDQIDHIDCCPTNNRWENLREASGAENSWNRRVGNDTTSGIKGVYWHKRDKRWNARIFSQRRNIFLGNFKTREEAEAAASAARKDIHGSFARMR